MMQNAYYTEGQPDADMAQLLGTVVRYPVTAGQPLTRGAIVGPQDRGFLAAALGPGMRAITLPVSVSTSVSGFIFPGDRVDIMLTQEVPGGGDGPALKVTETIVRNVRVLATDQRIDSKNEEGQTVVKTFSNVTFEVTPKLAEKMAVAQSLGSLSLSLRSIADNSAELERAIASGDVKVPEGMNPAQERQMLLAVANRPIDSSTTFSTGGDVSRFQRRSVPARATSQGAQTGELGKSASGVVPTGPVVRVARGNNVTVVPVGAR
jgi:pilus assembly protein CpaB